jgi:hypothetical protein
MPQPIAPAHRAGEVGGDAVVGQNKASSRATIGPGVSLGDGLGEAVAVPGLAGGVVADCGGLVFPGIATALLPDGSSDAVNVSTVAAAMVVRTPAATILPIRENRTGSTPRDGGADVGASTSCLEV